MIEWLKGYIITVAGCALLCTVANIIYPEGKSSQGAKFAFALLIIIALLAPLKNFKFDQYTLPAFNEVQMSDFDLADSLEVDVLSIVHQYEYFEKATAHVECSASNITSIAVYSNTDANTIIDDIKYSNIQKQLSQFLKQLYKVDNILITR